MGFWDAVGQVFGFPAGPDSEGPFDVDQLLRTIGLASGVAGNVLDSRSQNANAEVQAQLGNRALDLGDRELNLRNQNRVALTPLMGRDLGMSPQAVQMLLRGLATNGAPSGTPSTRPLDINRTPAQPDNFNSKPYGFSDNRTKFNPYEDFGYEDDPFFPKNNSLYQEFR